MAATTPTGSRTTSDRPTSSSKGKVRTISAKDPITMRGPPPAPTWRRGGGSRSPPPPAGRSRAAVRRGRRAGPRPAGPAPRPASRPTLEGGPGRHDGPVDVDARPVGDVAHHLLGGRVDELDHVGGSGRDPPSTDVQVLTLTHAPDGTDPLRRRPAAAPLARRGDRRNRPRRRAIATNTPSLADSCHLLGGGPAQPARQASPVRPVRRAWAAAGDESAVRPGAWAGEGGAAADGAADQGVPSLGRRRPPGARP